ncbi:MAG: enoyl-CoA hydratase/isomerase family protein [Chloroflexota bacterium]|jgi:enoyl-CoA hydratase
MSRAIEYDVVDETAILTINRPAARNALNWAGQRQFSEAVAEAGGDRALRALVITAAGDRSFASGGDMKELIDYPTRQDGLRVNEIMGEALTRLTRLPIPVIAAVNGDAVGGGCEIMTACDLRLAADDARFRFAQVQVGLTTGWGGAARLVHLIGAARALELTLTGRYFEAAEARSIGFVQQLVEREQVLTAALSWARELRVLPREALASLKRLAWEAADLSLAESYELERRLFADLWPGPDHLEAMAAFNAKRRPRFGLG